MNFKGMVFLLMIVTFFYMFFLYKNHLVFLLLFIEFSLLMIFFMFSVFMYTFFYMDSLFIFILVMVCLGGFSVALVVGLTRFVGRDYWTFGFLF